MWQGSAPQLKKTQEGSPPVTGPGVRAIALTASAEQLSDGKLVEIGKEPRNLQVVIWRWSRGRSSSMSGCNCETTMEFSWMLTLT